MDASETANPDGGHGGPAARAEFRAYWPIVLAGFVGIMTGAWAFPFQLVGPLTKPLIAEFGWSSSQIAFAASSLAAGSTSGTLLVGLMADRMSARALVVGSTFLLAGSLASLALMTGPHWQLMLCFFLMGFLGAGTGGLIFSRVIGSWFHRGRGLAIGIALSGSGASAFVTPLLAQWLLSFTGWREMVLVFALLVVIIAVPVVFVCLRPRAAAAAGTESGPAGTLYGVTRGEALKDYRFYILLIAATVFGLFLSGIVINLVPMLIDRGLPPMEAAAITSSLGIAMVCGRLLIGSMLDRFRPSLVGASIFLLGATGALALVYGGSAFALFMVVTLGLLLGAEVDILSFMTLRYFGNRNFGAIYGLLFLGYSGIAMASPLIAASLKAMGGYDLLFTLAGVGFLAAGVLTLGLNERKAPALEPAQA